MKKILLSFFILFSAIIQAQTVIETKTRYNWLNAQEFSDSLLLSYLSGSTSSRVLLAVSVNGNIDTISLSEVGLSDADILSLIRTNVDTSGLISTADSILTLVRANVDTTGTYTDANALAAVRANVDTSGTQNLSSVTTIGASTGTKMSYTSDLSPFLTREIPDAIWVKGQISDSIAALPDAKDKGWAIYVNDNYTSGSPLVVTSGTTQTLLLEAGTGSNIDYLPSDITTYIDTDDSTVVGKTLGDVLLLRVDFVASGASAGVGYLQIILESSGTTYYEHEVDVQGTDPLEVSETINLPMQAASFITPGTKIRLFAENDSFNVYDFKIVVTQLHRE